jgi:NitT/TauT family transport system substrate-binding protein
MIHKPTRRKVMTLLGAGAVASVVDLPRARAAAVDKADVMLDWHVTGYHAPFYLGVEQGIFLKHGIDLSITPGNGSRNTVLAVAANNAMFGLADSTALPAVMLQGADVKMFYSYLSTTPFGVMFKKGSGIVKPKDLEGRTYGDFPGSATYALFPAFAKHAGIDASKVKILAVSPATYLSAVLDGQIDSTFTALNDSFLTLVNKGNDLGNFSYASYGLNLRSQGLIASADTLKKTDLVKRFARAFSESVAAAHADPSKAAAAEKKTVPTAPDIPLQIKMLEDTFTNRLYDARSRGKQPGWMSEADWSETVDLLVQYGEVKEKVAIDRLFTNAYLPD